MRYYYQYRNVICAKEYKYTLDKFQGRDSDETGQNCDRNEKKKGQSAISRREELFIPLSHYVAREIKRAGASGGNFCVKSNLCEPWKKKTLTDDLPVI
ncbi:MAG TPA: hypothetical protein H9909_15330 [Candidatus Mediterraneibacter norfolkensis]|nr:hypothetical protein [Candidatus Mediterraneibacter norfolkensis]